MPKRSIPKIEGLVDVEDSSIDAEVNLAAEIDSLTKREKIALALFAGSERSIRGKGHNYTHTMNQMRLAFEEADMFLATCELERA